MLQWLQPLYNPHNEQYNRLRTIQLMFGIISETTILTNHIWAGVIHLTSCKCQIQLVVPLDVSVVMTT